MRLGVARGYVVFVVAALQAVGCHRPDPRKDSTAPSAVSSAARSPTAARDAGATAGVDPSLLEFRRLFALSQPGESFISDNVVSNETSLLQPARALAALRGGAYIGVGPEQNYTYIALTRPDFAVLMDLRRDNALLHLLYKALFDAAGSRLELLCLLFGRPYDRKLETEPSARADAVLTALEAVAPDRTWFERQHVLLKQRLDSYGLGLSSVDIEHVDHMHELFFRRQLEIHFELHENNGRTYPSLRTLLELRAPSGQGTFVDSEQSFRFVKTMHRQHRILPVVGDVSAPQPLGAIADELARRALPLRTLYISNVEQYLIGTPKFAGWLDNLRGLSHDERSIIVRCYLDQGRAHPRQRAGERTTSVAHRLEAFLETTKRRLPRSYYDVAADEALLVGPAGRPCASTACLVRAGAVDGSSWRSP
jgi:hypothetical protein